MPAPTVSLTVTAQMSPAGAAHRCPNFDFVGSGLGGCPLYDSRCVVDRHSVGSVAKMEAHLYPGRGGRHVDVILIQLVDESRANRIAGDCYMGCIMSTVDPGEDFDDVRREALSRVVVYCSD